MTEINKSENAVDCFDDTDFKERDAEHEEDVCVIFAKQNVKAKNRTDTLPEPPKPKIQSIVLNEEMFNKFVQLSRDKRKNGHKCKRSRR